MGRRGRGKEERTMVEELKSDSSHNSQKPTTSTRLPTISAKESSEAKSESEPPNGAAAKEGDGPGKEGDSKEDAESAKQPARPNNVGMAANVLKAVKKVFKRGAVEPVEPEEPKSICHKMRHFVVDPAGKLDYWWTAVVTLVALYNTAVLVARVVFRELESQNWHLWLALDYIGDLVNLADLLFNSRTGYLEQGLLVREDKALLLNYVRSSGFKWDVLAVLPTDLCYLALPMIAQPAWRFNRLAKLPAAADFTERTETRTSYPNAFRIFCVILYIVIIIHWNGCLYFQLSEWIGIGSDPWVYGALNKQSNPPGLGRKYDNESLSRKYVYSFFWSTLTLTTIGETPAPVTDFQFLFVTFDFLVGVLVFATIVGNVGTMITNMTADRTEFQGRMDSVKKYMAFRRVANDLQTRVIKCLTYHGCKRWHHTLLLEPCHGACWIEMHNLPETRSLSTSRTNRTIFKLQTLNTMTYLSCPLCSASVPSVSLELHLRSEISYTPLRCLLCPLRFFSLEDGTEHFRGPFAAHPREELALAERPDRELEARLRELLGTAGRGNGCTGACGCCERLAAMQRRGGGDKLASDREDLPPQAYTPEDHTPYPSTQPVEQWSQGVDMQEYEVQSESAEAFGSVKSEPMELAERKPEAASDGKVACLLCGHRVGKLNFKQHAQRAHVSASPFHCNLCPYKAKVKINLQSHLKTRHQAALSDETMTVLDLRADIEDRKEECFGSARAMGTATTACRACKEQVPLEAKKQHAAMRHLKKAIHACRLCPFTSAALGGSQMRQHLKAKHAREMSEKTAHSEADKYAPIVKRMVPDLFDA